MAHLRNVGWRARLQRIPSQRASDSDFAHHGPIRSV